MGLFKKSKKEENEPVLEQDLTQGDVRPGMVFAMQLLMKEKCEMPAREDMLSALGKRLGEVECFTYDEKMAGFAPKKYTAEFKEGSMPPMLVTMGCTEREKDDIDALTRSQMWDCKNADEILSSCKYMVLASDMLGGAIKDYKERADMLMDYMEALMEIYPQCEAVLITFSGKLFSREQIVNHKIPRKDRFIYFGVNVRFFRINGTEDDMMVDTLGMGTLYLPDLQYHFHGMDPNWVINHAYNLLSYIYDNDAPIKDGETIDGIADGRIDKNVYWKCHYEDALIQPMRPVMDICMNEYAAGKRDY